MSATSPALPTRSLLRARVRRPAIGGLALPLRALVVSRVIVLAAGVAGTLAVPRVDGWQTFDPGRISTSLGSVGNVLAASAVRWDSIHYLAIAQHGYSSAKDARFMPLYPIVIRAVSYLVGSAVLAGIVISVAAFVAAMILLHRLTELELGGAAAGSTILLLAFAPLSFFFSAVYTESLFLALSVGAFYAARRRRMGLAVTLGMLASLARVTGVLLAIPIGMLYLRQRGRLDRQVLAVLALPGALLTFLGFLAASGYGLLAPIHGQVAQNLHQFTGPVGALVGAVSAASGGARVLLSGAQPIYQSDVTGVLSAGAESIVLLGLLGLTVLTLIAAFRRLPIAYGVYAGLALMVCLWSPVADQPLQSFDRYTLTIFPLWMAGGAWISERRLTRVAVLLGGALLAFYTFQFARWSFVA